MANLPYIFLEDVDSTSAEVRRRMNAGGQTLPFAVVAAEQSAGRGQRQHQWQSPRGNLYLSIALPGYLFDEEQAPNLSSWWAALLCEWLRQETNISVFVKWPNDVVILGRKLGGILVECSIQSSSIDHVIVGIGLNVSVAPHVDGLQSVCLNDLGIDLSATVVAASLIKFVQTRLQSKGFNADALLREYALFNDALWLEAGSGGTKFVGGFCFEDKLAKLRLRALPRGGQVRDIISASDELRPHWAAQWPKQKIFLADVGNSATKFYSFSSGRCLPEEYHGTSGAWPKDLHSGQPLYAIAVNQAHLESLKKDCFSRGVELLHVPKRRVLSHGSRYAFADLGIDRLCAMEGACRINADRSRALIVVGAGTATTIDLLSPNREHLGGWIIPGVATAIKALQTHGAQLPKTAIALDKLEIPNDLWRTTGTRDAMLFGSIGISVSSIRCAMEMMKEQFESEVAVYVAGGFAEHLSALIKEAHMHQTLIPMGMLTLMGL